VGIIRIEGVMGWGLGEVGGRLLGRDHRLDRVDRCCRERWLEGSVGGEWKSRGYKNYGLALAF